MQPRQLTRWRTYHSIRQHAAAAVWLRTSERWRWRVIERLNRSRLRCWSELVNAALAEREDDLCDVSVPRLRVGSPPACASTCYWLGHTGEHTCSCYCNKFEFTATNGIVDRYR